MKYKLMAITMFVVATLLSPLLAWICFLDLITDDEFSKRFLDVWERG